MIKFTVTLVCCAFLLNVYAQQKINPAVIDIVRDSFGVPHIFAKTDAEVSYGLAWAEAEDDFASMQELLLPCKGLAGRIKGKDGAAADYVFELFRCRQITEEKWHTLSPSFLKLIDGYLQGVNNYAATHPEAVMHKKLFPINAKDYIASSVLALTIFNGADKALTRILKNKEYDLPEFNKKGSNAVAVHANKTTSGEAFLLVNAHQPNTGPLSFYEAHICSEEGLNVTGGLLAGGPCILHGVNEYLGWAHTVNYCDRLDEFQLEMNPTNKLQYKFDGEWLTLEVKKVKLKIKGVPINVSKKIYWSKYGATMKNKQGFFSLRLGANMKIGAMEQWYYMNKAKNFTEFYTALQKQELSMFNIMYADRYDTIFYINNALMPERNNNKKYTWKLTVPGNTSQTLWTTFRKLESLPQYINPSSGFLFNTNHSPFYATAKEDNLKMYDFPVTDGWEFYHLNRSERFLELFPKTEKISFEKFKEIKFDKQLPKRLRYTYNIDSMYLLDETQYPNLATPIKNFKAWDKQGDTKSKGAAIFLLTYLNVTKTIQNNLTGKMTQQNALASYKHASEYMQKNFGSDTITLGDLQKLVRGGKEWPLWGFPDVLSPQWTAPHKNGTLKSIGGDGLIMFIRFAKNSLPQIETVNMYGASAQSGNKHFEDQVELYLNQKTKRMSLDKAEVYRTAERIYHPN
jgi:acyl-homoserine-lactone acylase